MKRSNKATHKGTCQICGRKQRLPYDRLSKHGYTTKYGWFEGVCIGSENKPFEKSTDLIEGVIKSVKKQMEGLKQEIEKLETDTSEVWVNVYYDYRIVGHKNSGYVWELHKKEDVMIEIHEDSELVTFTLQSKKDDSKNGVERIAQYSGVKTLEDAIIKQNEKRIHFYETRIKEMISYITWQEERVANWVECELEEIK